MKNPHSTLLATAAICLAIGATVPLLLGHHRFDPERQSLKSEVPALATSPKVPASVSFAGQEIDLRRYDRHERMDRELMSFTFMHSTTLQNIKRANRYFPVIEPILRAEGVPDDFKYLAVIESSLNTRAKSPVGAAGMWQFMPAAGREFGLEVNANIDERYHVEKATRAACRFLKEAYGRYGDWLSVAASYNAGMARISSQLDKQQAKTATDLWLVDETSRYIFRLLAAKCVISNPARYGFVLKRTQLYPPLAYTEVRVDTGIPNLVQFALGQGVTYAQLKDANPWLRDDFLQNRSRRTYILRIPTQASMHYDPSATRAHSPSWVID